LVERLVRNEEARGSNPLTSTTTGLLELVLVSGGIAQLVEHLLCKQGVGGSSPLVSTKVATAESVAIGTSLATVGRGSKSPDHHSRRPRIALRDRDPRLV
jgi:hypothetical protein